MKIFYIVLLTMTICFPIRAQQPRTTYADHGIALFVFNNFFLGYLVALLTLNGWIGVPIWMM
ncbi:hypothetical protein [Sphingobacterium sp. SYP-B4668]|uniref:hypothetical protein n=1 Tax=Sphingobacterium sp. SYP-B4668 TaxID=2996035 RepID=UPI0022DD407D|nr:hypothetical protein [Sphingobacterium sp. SYP-B4668]